MFPVLQQLLLNSLKIKEEDPPVLKSVKESIAQDLSTRYQEHALKSLLKMTSFLDPRFKEQPYLTESEKTAVMLNTRKDLIEECMITSDPPTADLVVNLDEDPPSPKKKGRVSALLGELFNSCSEASSTRTAEEKSRVEVQRYTAEEQLDLDNNPLEWWKQRIATYPYLSQLVRRLYCNQLSIREIVQCGWKFGNGKTKLLATREYMDRMLFLFEDLNEEPLLLNEEDEGSEDKVIGEAED